MSGAMGGAGTMMLGAEAGGMLGIVEGAPGSPPGTPRGGAAAPGSPPGGSLSWAVATLAGNAQASEHTAIALDRDMVVLPQFPCAPRSRRPWRLRPTVRDLLPPHDPELRERDNVHQIPRLHLGHILRDVDQPVRRPQAGDQAGAVAGELVDGEAGRCARAACRARTRAGRPCGRGRRTAPAEESAGARATRLRPCAAAAATRRAGSTRTPPPDCRAAPAPRCRRSGRTTWAGRA